MNRQPSLDRQALQSAPLPPLQPNRAAIQIHWTESAVLDIEFTRGQCGMAATSSRINPASRGVNSASLSSDVSSRI